MARTMVVFPMVAMMALLLAILLAVFAGAAWYTPKVHSDSGSPACDNGQNWGLWLEIPGQDPCLLGMVSKEHVDANSKRGNGDGGMINLVSSAGKYLEALARSWGH